MKDDHRRRIVEMLDFVLLLSLPRRRRRKDEAPNKNSVHFRKRGRKT